MDYGPGSIAAIAIGIILAVTLVVAATWVYIHRRRTHSYTRHGASNQTPVISRPQVRTDGMHGKENSFSSRSLQSHWYGGSASSTTNIHATAHSPSNSVSSTLYSNLSRKAAAHASRNSSIISLPVDVRHSSLRLNPITSENKAQISSVGSPPRQGGSSLSRTWEMKSIKSRRSSASSVDGGESNRSASPISLFPAPPISSKPPQIDIGMKDFRASFMSIFPEPAEDVKIRDGPIIKTPMATYSRQSYKEPVSPTLQNSAPPIPVRERSFYGNSARRMSTKNVETESVKSASRGESAPTQRSTRVLSAVGDWGAAIFKEIDTTLEDSRSLTASPVKRDHASSHSSRPSSTESSIYSIHDGFNPEILRAQFPELNGQPMKTVLRTSAMALRPVGKAKELMVTKSLPSTPLQASFEHASLSVPTPVPQAIPLEILANTRFSSSLLIPTNDGRPPSSSVPDVYEPYWHEARVENKPPPKRSTIHYGSQRPPLPKNPRIPTSAMVAGFPVVPQSVF